MLPNLLSPRESINKAYLKVKPNRNQIETFKSNILNLLENTNNNEFEEYNKNLVSEFLKDTWYAPSHCINTKGRADLVIHNGKDAASTVGVLFEVKKPENRAEMPSRSNLCSKAFYELILYYLRERITYGNIAVKHLIITDIYEWFIFSSVDFDRIFAGNTKLVQDFKDFDEGRLADKTTDFFYSNIAAQFVKSSDAKISFTYFDIRDYKKIISNPDTRDDRNLIVLYKIFSPEHLLRLPFTNDSNTLDKSFYTELLHIIGLEESKTGSKKIIGRKVEERRNSGSLIENTLNILRSEDCLSQVRKRSDFGNTSDEQYYNISLELVITWINRILFLKLLEGQLIRYNGGDRNFSFLNNGRIEDFDELNKLFFRVLAVKEEDRNEDIRKKYTGIPFLNSSLFEPTDIEHTTLRINSLDDNVTIPVLPGTVLKDRTGKKLTGSLNPLQYLFSFLDSYDFSSEGSEEIQEDNKTLINASVLGLIFEKINGYKDGSFFTPGFITMYMCHETITRAVVQKFNEAKGWNCESLTDIYNRDPEIKEANRIINNLKICDPAVGSGHFLVSALNEIIAVKSELGILADKDGKRLKDYTVEVINDELVITDSEGKFFEYNPKNKESQRVQETIFKEKQTIIENCLFGVDINPNSVKICRLRLWIELLKNAYYKTGDNTKHETRNAQLETLPNIDINIKCGNSLISRYPLDADIRTALRSSKWTIDNYREAVMTYRNARSKDEKRSMEELIRKIKTDFETEVSHNDKRYLRLNKLKGELMTLSGQTTMFELSKKEKDEWNKKVVRLTAEIKGLESQMAEIKDNIIYENAFEWRFEFPEVLNDDGDFVGFDVVIGNPPYIRQEELSNIKVYLQNNYETFNGTADLYVYFVERGLKILRANGTFIYILPNKWMRAGYGKNLRSWVKQFSIDSIVDFGDLPVFEEATTYPCLWSVIKNSSSLTSLNASIIDTLTFPNGLKAEVEERKFNVDQTQLKDIGWMLINSNTQQLLKKIKSSGIPLINYVGGKIYYGIKTGFNEAFVIDESTKNRLIDLDFRSSEIIKPFLAGRDIKRYQQPKYDSWLILIPKGRTIKILNNKQIPVNYENAWTWFSEYYHSIASYLSTFHQKAEKRLDKGDFWWELRGCDYYEEFEQDKIIYPNICKRPEFVFDMSKSYTNQKCFIITSSDLYLLGLLNSSLFFYLFRMILPKLRGDFYEPGLVYIKDFPIVDADFKQKNEIISIVSGILKIKDHNPEVDTFALESEIDRCVYKIYGLNEEEIRIVEGLT